MKLGFTLVELIASFSIIVIIALGVFLQFRSLSSTQALENGLDIARSVLIDARTRALTGIACCATDTIPFGYGVYIELNDASDNTLIVFADVDGDYKYNTIADAMITTTILDDDISLTSCADDIITTTSGSCTVVFPIARIGNLYYNGVPANGKGITYMFIEPDSGITQSIILYLSTYVVE